MHQHHICESQTRSAYRGRGESPQSRALVAIVMLCVPLICFGCVLAVYLILTI